MTDNANISVSDRAANRIREIMAQARGQNALRISVQGGGCSGFRYDFEIVARRTRTISSSRSRRARGDRSGLGSVYGGLGDRFCGRSDRRIFKIRQPERDGVLRLRHLLFRLGPAVLSVATWNVNSIKQRETACAAWLKQAAPDVLCLQELKCQTDGFPRGTFEDLGYNCAVLGQKSFNGVALLSKYPIDETVTATAGRRRETGRPAISRRRSRFPAARRSASPRSMRRTAIPRPRGSQTISSPGSPG